MKRYAIALFLLVVLSGCFYAVDDSVSPSLRRVKGGFVVKPVIVVTDFDNRSGFSGQWNLGSGMADVLVTELVRTGDVVVLDRRHVNDILAELSRQRHGESRAEGRVRSGRMRNARYLVRGTVTDFTVSGDASGWFGVPAAAASLGASVARVDLHLSVSDVETGEVVASVQEAGRASRGFLSAAVEYPKISFGGRAFFRTPLGMATSEASRRSITRLLNLLPLEYWEARVAEVEPDRVVINGGENVGLKKGSLFVVREKGRDITDPITGDVIDVKAGPMVGRIEVTEVRPMASHARLVEGRAGRGDLLEPVSREPETESQEAPPVPYMLDFFGD